MADLRLNNEVFRFSAYKKFLPENNLLFIDKDGCWKSIAYVRQSHILFTVSRNFGK